MITRRNVLTQAVPALALPAAAMFASGARAAAACAKPSTAIVREKYDRYIALYNAGDPAFAQFYHDDVVMETVPPLTSAKAILDFSRELRMYIAETIHVEHYVADETGSAAQFLGEFRCVRDMPASALQGLFGQAVRAGQVRKQRGIILYGVSQGKFKWIRAAPPIVVQDWS